MARVRRTVVPKFIQINTQADYNKHIKPALGKGADAYELEDIKGMWWELDDDTRLGAAKTIREIRDGIDKRPRFIFISGAGDERGITAMSLSEYAENMGLSVKDYLNGFTLESREVCGPLQESNTPKSYVLAHKGPNDTTYCKNKAGDWTTHIEDAWEGSGPDSFSAEMKRNFADAVHCDVEDLEVVPVEKFESVEFDTPHFKPRTYEGEYILYVLYGLDKDGDETDELAWSKNADVLKKKIAATLPDYKDAYAGFHVVAICYDKNGEMRDSVVVWSADQNESKGADETIEFEKGHKNSRGENAPWVIRDHKNGKVLASFAKKGDAEAHLERMKSYSKNEVTMGMNIKVNELKKCEGGYEDTLRGVETVARQVGGSTGYKPGRASYEDGIYHVSLQKGGEEIAVYAPHDGGEWELWDYDSNEDPRLIVHAADPGAFVRKAVDVLKRPQSKRTAVDYDNKGESKKCEGGYEDTLRSVETVARQVGGSTGYKPGRASYEDGIYHVSLQKGGEEIAVYAPHDGGEWELWDYDSNEDPRLIVHAADPGAFVRKAVDVLKRPQSKRTAVDYDNKGESKKCGAEAHLERMKRYSKNEASSRIVADNRLGKITKARLRDNTLAFYPLEDDGKDDDCIYFFRLDGNDIVTKGYQWGRDGVDYGMIAEDGYPWTAEPGRPTRDYVHTKKYAKYLLDRVRKCLDLGVATEKGHVDATHLEGMKHYKRNENSVMDWANKIKAAVANAAKAAGLENRITASATNMPKLFVDVYQIGTMSDGINWEITGNLGVRRFDRQSVRRHWSVDSIEELEKSLTDEFQQLKDGKLSGKTEAISISDLLSRLKAADPEKAKHIIRAFHDEYGYWVEFPDEVSTYEPGTHTLHEYSVAELLRAYKRSKIVGAKGESYERATKEIQVRKNGQPWTRYAVTWPEYVDTYTKEAKERGWDEVRVIDLGGKGKHEALFNAKALEDLAMNGIKSAIMAAWSGAEVKNFKLDIQRNDYNLDVYSKTLDGVPTGTSWRVLPMAGAIARYADNLTNGSTEVVADIPYITDDDVERIFTDEFKKLDDDMSEGYVSKEGNWGANNPDGFRKLDDLLEAAGFQCTFDDRFGDELVARDGEKFYVIEYNVPPDMVVDKNKPWEIFNGDSGEFMKNFVDPETAASYLTAKKGKE